MAKDIADVLGIVEDTDFPTGYKIVDGQTFVSAELYQDMIQTFQKMLDLASIVPNGNFDNEVNGYQMLNALFRIIEEIVVKRTNFLITRETEFEWNMDTTPSYTINLSYLALEVSDFNRGLFNLNAVVKDNNGNFYDFISAPSDPTLVKPVSGSIDVIASTQQIRLQRPDGGFFNSSDFTSAIVYVSFSYYNSNYYQV